MPSAVAELADRNDVQALTVFPFALALLSARSRNAAITRMPSYEWGHQNTPQGFSQLIGLRPPTFQ